MIPIHNSHGLTAPQVSQGVNALSPQLVELASAVARQQGASIRARMTEEAEQKALESELQGLEEELKQQEVRIKQLEETKAKLQKIVVRQIPLTSREIVLKLLLLRKAMGLA